MSRRALIKFKNKQRTLSLYFCGLFLVGLFGYPTTMSGTEPFYPLAILALLCVMVGGAGVIRNIERVGRWLVSTSVRGWTLAAFVVLVSGLGGWDIRRTLRELEPVVLQDQFSVTVPFNEGNGEPIQPYLSQQTFDLLSGKRQLDPAQVPNDPRQWEDSRESLYRKLGDLARWALVTRGDLWGNVAAINKSKPTSEIERLTLLAEVLQFYVIEQVDLFQRDENISAAMLGGPGGVVTSRGNPPPNATKIEPQVFLSAISDNRLSKCTEFGAPAWRVSQRGYLLPPRTKVALQNEASKTSVRHVFALENAALYRLEVAVETNPAFGAEQGVPREWDTASRFKMDGIRSHHFIVRLLMKYRRFRNTDSQQQDEYVKWSAALFSRLKRSFAAI